MARVASRLLGLMSLSLVVCGCGTGQSRAGAPKSVFWNAHADCGPGFYIYLEPLRTVKDVAARTRLQAEERREFCLAIVNNTGTPLFLARIGDHPYTPALYSVRIGKRSWGGDAFEICGGSRMTFDYLATGPFPGLLWRDDTVAFVNFSVPWLSGAGKADLYLEFPLIYCVEGKAGMNDLTVRKCLEIE